MLTRAVRVRLVVFLVVSIFSISYLAVRYVGVTQWLGLSGYHVTVEFPSSGGIFSNAEVDYRGVPVGRVGAMRLSRDGITVELDITSSRHIPATAQAVVADRSVIGEQYVDLRPSTDSGPWLKNGSRLTSGSNDLPLPVQDLLYSADQLARSVPITALQTTIGSLYQATRNVHSSLSALISSSNSLFTSLNNVLPQTVSLIDTSATVLATQTQESGAISQFATNLELIGKQLKSSNSDISSVLRQLPGTASTVTDLFDTISGSLHDLLSNLLATSAVFYATKNGLKSLLVNLPVAVTVGGMVTTPQGINVGLVPTFFNPLPCTAGYGSTAVRSGLSTSGDPALNTAAGCTATGTDLHGAAHAPGN